MRKILLLLTLLVSSAGIIHAAETSYTTGSLSSKKPWSSSGTTATLNNVDWTLTFTSATTQAAACASDAAGFKIGSNKYYISTATLSTAKIPDTIKEIQVTTHRGSGLSALKLSATVGSTEFLCNNASTAAPTSESATYTFTGEASGEIILTWNRGSSGSGAIYITEIKVIYGEAGPKEPVEYTFDGLTDQMTLAIGESYDLNPYLKKPLPKGLLFSSSNPTIASVDESGKITAIAVGSTTISASWSADDNYLASYGAVTLLNVTVEKPAPTKTDVITRKSFTDTSTGSSYTSYNFTSEVTGIKYLGTFIAKSNIQLNNKNNAGIVTAENPNGYVLKEITVKWGSSQKQLDFYGKETAYTATSALYNTYETNSGKIFGNLSNDGTIVVDNPYKFFGLRSNSGVTYIDEITLVWEIPETKPVDYTALSNLTIPALFPGDTYQLPLGEKYPADMIMASTDGSVVTVTNGGLLTAVKPGTTTISVEWDADDVNNFTAGNAEIEVTVKKPLETASMSFLHNVVYGKLGVGVVGQAAYYNGNGTIEYKSSDETILKVNPATGMITKADVLRTGEVTITATAPETADFHAATASYTIIVQDPNEVNNFQADQTMFDFTPAGAYGMTLFSSGTEYETTVTSITPEKAPVTLAFTGTYRQWKGTDNNQLRAYSKATMTFSVPDGYYITKITINQIKGNYTAYKTVDCQTGEEIGKISTGSAGGSTQRVWEAFDSNGNDIDVSSVTLKVNDNPDQANITTMTVVWKKATSEQKPAELSFTTTLYNDLVGTEIKVNAVNNPHTVPVAYSIDNLEEGTDYTIDDEVEPLIVKVNKTGVYTLRAKGSKTDEYLPGIAILRLNVFPAVELKLNDGEAFDLTEEGEIVLPEDGGSFTIEGNYPNTVRIWYALNDEAEQLYDGTPVEFTDDATLTYHLEYAETDRYRYTTNHSICVTPPAPVCNINHGEEIPTDATLTFTSKEGTTLLYRVNVTEPTANSAMRAPAATEGWDNNGTNTYSFDASELTAGTKVVVSTKALHSNGRIESAQTARAFTVGSGTVTGVENVEAAADNAPVEFFNLQGIRVANPENGIYIRRQGNTVEKVTINN